MIYKYLHLFALDADKLPQVTPTGDTLRTLLGFVFGLASAIAFLFIALAGFRYVLSRGDTNAIKNAKEIIIYAVVGLVVSLSGFAIVQFVFKGLSR